VKVRALLAFAALWLGGCGSGGFFEELQSVNSAGEDSEGEDSEGDETGTDSDAVGDCDFPVDDQCANQDTLHQCDPDTLTFETFDCTLLCGEYVNLSCITTGTAQHGCYCVQPGQLKQYSCTELETCVAGCGGDGACEDVCFSRTTASTVRLFGALMYCATADCHETCVDRPEFCGSCIAETIATGRGACGLPRSVCNNDVNDDPNAPWG
jgi:hypothetical protein